MTALDAEERGRDAEPAEGKLLGWMAKLNIAEELEGVDLSALGMAVTREYDIDVQSCAGWKEKVDKALRLAAQDSQPKVYPWTGASNIIYPVLTTAAIQFAARAYPAIVQGKNVVKGSVVGDDSGITAITPRGPVLVEKPGTKAARAKAIGEHMSWQLLSEMEEWEEQTDLMLHVLPVVGCGFRKTYFDPALGRNCALFASAIRVVINYKAKSVEAAPRVTEEVQYYPYEIEEMERSGVFRRHTYGPVGEDNQGDDDAPHVFLEQHRRWDLDGDGYAEPYIVTVHKESSFVVRIVARYDGDGIRIDAEGRVLRIAPVHYYTKYDFLPNPEGGIYGFGFAHYLRPINEAINTSLNQMIDAGHLSNTGAGFIADGLSMRAGNVKFQVGQFIPVRARGMSVRDAVFQLNFPGPNATMFQLLGLLIEAAKDVAAVKDVLIGDQPNANVPAATTLALIDQGLKVFTGIYKRIYRSLKKEFVKLYRLNRIYLSEESSYRIGNEWRQITRDDYEKGSGVEPVADPTTVSDMQKLGRASYLESFKGDPVINQVELRKRLLDAAAIEKTDELIVTEPPPNPIMLAQLAELQMKLQESKANQMQDVAHAILFLAQAAKLSNDAHIDWYDQQLDMMRLRLEQVSAGGAGGPGQPQGAVPAGMGPVAAAPGNGAVSPLS